MRDETDATVHRRARGQASHQLQRGKEAPPAAQLATLTAHHVNIIKLKLSMRHVNIIKLKLSMRRTTRK